MLQDKTTSKDVFYACYKDAKKAEAWLSAICGPHSLRQQNSKELGFRYSGHKIGLNGTFIGTLEYGNDVVINIPEHDLNNSFRISLPITGAQKLYNKKGEIFSDSNTALILGNEEQELLIQADCSKIHLVAPLQAMQAALFSILKRPVNAPIVFEHRMDAVNGTTASWWRLVRHLCSELPYPDCLYKTSPISPELEINLLKGLLFFQKNTFSDELDVIKKQAFPPYFPRLKTFIETHAKENISFEDMLSAARVSRYKLYGDFHYYFGVPPMTFVKRYRLEKIREELLGSNSHKYVSSVALDWGFTHLGRFADDYRKLFNELPSETVQRKPGPNTSVCVFP